MRSDDRGVDAAGFFRSPLWSASIAKEREKSMVCFLHKYLLLQRRRSCKLFCISKIKLSGQKRMMNTSRWYRVSSVPSITFHHKLDDELTGKLTNAATAFTNTATVCRRSLHKTGSSHSKPSSPYLLVFLADVRDAVDGSEPQLSSGGINDGGDWRMGLMMPAAAK
jgi:hypothetical protein